MLFARCCLVFSLLVAIFSSPAAWAAPKAELWQRWSAHNPASERTVDHSVWDRFLTRYVIASADGVNRVDYGKIKAADREELQDYVVGLTAIPVSDLNRNQQQAYWINLYNALTVQLILDHSPLASIRDINISPGFFSSGPWGKKLAKIEDVDVSLDDIEHRILRPIWRDPRVHYAVNCASIGCPNLRRRAFVADKLADQLDQAARDYINNSRGARIEGGKLYVSSIYEWFMDDFGGSEQTVIDHLRRYADPELTARLKNINRIEDDAYDWSLNKPKPYTNLQKE